jgi:cell division septum initiation protein DivIVA
MSSAPVSPHGFVTVRGRGYRPDQADAFASALSGERDAAWERAARLTVLAREMEEGLEELRETVAGLAPQTYETLGEGAQRVFRFACEEAESVRERARLATRECVARARERAEEVRRVAREEADALLAEADARVRERLETARAEADEIRVAARRALKEERARRLVVLREVRQRTEALVTGQEREHAERWAEVEREAGESAAALDASNAGRIARAEQALAEAERALADAERGARRRQEEARARAAEIIAEARLTADGIARETERVLREHGERWDAVQAQMDAARNRIEELTRRRTPVE